MQFLLQMLLLLAIANPWTGRKLKRTLITVIVVGLGLFIHLNLLHRLIMIILASRRLPCLHNRWPWCRKEWPRCNSWVSMMSQTALGRRLAQNFRNMSLWLTLLLLFFRILSQAVEANLFYVVDYILNTVSPDTDEFTRTINWNSNDPHGQCQGCRLWRSTSIV